MLGSNAAAAPVNIEQVMDEWGFCRPTQTLSVGGTSVEMWN